MTQWSYASLSSDIAFEGAQLPAYFIAGGEGKRPTLIAPGGFDSTMEEIYGWIGPVASQYGWHCLIFEGPGQWAALKASVTLGIKWICPTFGDANALKSSMLKRCIHSPLIGLSLPFLVMLK